jgi:hypothetical protein
MEHKIINIGDYLLIVDDSEIKEGDTYCRIDTGLLFSSLKGSNPNIIEKYCKKIIAHLPLNNSPILEGVPLLPSLKDEVDKFESFLDREIELGLNTKETIDRIKWYYQKYFKSKQKNYTEEDLINAMFKATKWDTFKEDDVEYSMDMSVFFNHIIQSLQQPKMPIGFKCEIQAMNIDEIREQGKGFLNTNTKKLKTITNSQGLTQLVGEYIY